jgi:chemotaxis-related protein WspB
MLVLTFQIGSDRLALDTRHVKEVVPRVPLQAVTGAPAWLAGVIVYRGNVVPVVDLHRLAGAGDCPLYLSSRIVLIRRPGGDSEQLLGLLAAQVADLRELTDTTAGGTTTGLGRVLADGSGVLQLIEPERLLPDEARARLAAPGGGPP